MMLLGSLSEMTSSRPFQKHKVSWWSRTDWSTEMHPRGRPQCCTASAHSQSEEVTQENSAGFICWITTGLWGLPTDMTKIQRQKLDLPSYLDKHKTNTTKTGSKPYETMIFKIVDIKQRQWVICRLWETNLAKNWSVHEWKKLSKVEERIIQRD